MCCEHRPLGDTSTIRVRGRFVFSCQSAFRAACDKALARAETRAIHIDLSQVEYLDSSALGMLLLLKEKATPLGKRASWAPAA
ncbi:MAG TPA: STAS domain-containing protein [Thiobacillaceae bacterium]|nr:STAS domain-containing protein [Thiobacillaceae bacterium]